MKDVETFVAGPPVNLKFVELLLLLCLLLYPLARVTKLLYLPLEGQEDREPCQLLEEQGKGLVLQPWVPHEATGEGEAGALPREGEGDELPAASRQSRSSCRLSRELLPQVRDYSPLVSGFSYD